MASRLENSQKVTMAMPMAARLRRPSVVEPRAWAEMIGSRAGGGHAAREERAEPPMRSLAPGRSAAAAGRRAGIIGHGRGKVHIVSTGPDGEQPPSGRAGGSDRMQTMSKAIEATHGVRRGPGSATLGWIGLAALAAALAATPVGARAGGPLQQQPSAVSPYRFAPPDQPLSPLEEQKAQQYQGQLQQQIFNYDRTGKTLTPLQNQQLQGARGELFRMNQFLLPPK
jgi:hypothetical protein